MMIHAYDEMYLDIAMNNLGEAFDYVANTLSMDKDKFFELFISTEIATQFGDGNSSYISGMSGIELVDLVLSKAGISYSKESIGNVNKTPDFWCGWILAYYQWYSKRPFSNIARFIKISDVENMYNIFHEAPEEKFCENIEKMIIEKNGPTRLQIIRKNAGFTQGELSEKSGVSLRSIQMYEQRNKDINKAQLDTVSSLAKTLGCSIEDLIEY